MHCLQEQLLKRMHRYSRQLVHGHPFEAAAQIAWGLALVRKANSQSLSGAKGQSQPFVKALFKVGLHLVQINPNQAVSWLGLLLITDLNQDVDEGHSFIRSWPDFM